MKNIALLSLANLLLLLVGSNRLLADDYEPFADKQKPVEISINAGYSIITHEKSIFWDNGLTYGLGLNYNFTKDMSLGLSAGFTEYRPNESINQIDREYRYEIYPLMLNFQNRLGIINEMEIFAGIGLAYVYGEYIIDEFQYLTEQRRIRIRYKYATNGFGIVPNAKVRSPFGDNLALDVSLDYTMLFMESRNSAELSLDHINAKIALVYRF
jgi:hypothetical protein